MGDSDVVNSQVEAWLLPLVDSNAPCGPELEYDNEFLSLNQACAGKPESQFGAAEPPNWRAAADIAASLLARTRDLRVAISWLRAQVHVSGYNQLGTGLRLVNGLLSGHWEHVHPQPDPDDGDPYGRVNALTVLSDPEGLLGDLRVALLVNDRAVGQVSGRQFELALGLGTAHAGETAQSRDQLELMLNAALQKEASLAPACRDALAQTKQLMATVNEKLGVDAPELKALHALVNGIAQMIPPERVEEEAQAEGAEGEAADGSSAGGKARAGLSGAVNTRAEAIRAIEMVCEYLERAEPANPAPLFLRRASQLISHNFLQLLKVLAPESLASVAGLVGIDPEHISGPDGP